MNGTIIPAPRMAAANLWALSPEDFNAWRRNYDFPRILAFARRRLASFDTWCTTYAIDDNMMLQCGPAAFLVGMRKSFYYHLRASSGPDDHIVSERPVTPHRSATIAHKLEFMPYVQWAAKQRIHVLPSSSSISLSITRVTRRGTQTQAYLAGELELLGLGGIRLPRHYIMGPRLLEFTTLSHLTLNHAISNRVIRCFFCQADHLRVTGDLPFLNWYGSNLEDILVEDSRLQSWDLAETRISGVIRRSTIHLWTVRDPSFGPLLENTDILDSQFKFRPWFSREIEQIRHTSGNLKRLFASRGRILEAADHYYHERIMEMRTLANPLFHKVHLFRGPMWLNGTLSDIFKDPRRSDWRARMRDLVRLFGTRAMRWLNPVNWPLLLEFRLKFFLSFLSWIWWGFGERPGRILAWSTIIIAGFSAIYWSRPDNNLKDFYDALYTSCVTFSTLGYSNITPTDSLKPYLAIESLLGALAMGFTVAGFAGRRNY